MKNKQSYDNIPNYKMIYCKNCNKKYPKIKYGVRELSEDGENGICKMCIWLKRHNYSIPNIDGWEQSEIQKVLEYVIMNDCNILNDLLLRLNNKTLYDLCYVTRFLQLHNYGLKILEKCSCCGKDVYIKPSRYLKNNNIYCSDICYWKDKTNKVPHGKESPYYNRVNTNCTNCGKPISIIPYNYDLINNYGDNHNFCCRECYWEYRAKYYVGDKHHLKGTTLSSERIELLRENMAKQLSSLNRLDTSIQIKINDILDNLNIQYTREFNAKYYSVDNYLNDYNLMIEVMGDYWHANPLKYNINKYYINSKQSEGIIRDKLKHSYIKNHYNIEILYLWETDIKNNPILCQKLILKYIETNGMLENYHSFNYFMDDNIITFKSQKDIIIPYQQMKIDEYRYLIKDKIS